MSSSVTPMLRDRSLRCAAGAAMNHRNVAITPEREHREHRGLALVVRAGQHQRARHQAERRRGLVVAASRMAPKSSPCATRTTIAATIANAPLPISERAERDAGQHEPGEERGGHVALPRPGPRRSSRRPPRPRSAPASSDRRGPRRPTTTVRGAPSSASRSARMSSSTSSAVPRSANRSSPVVGGGLVASRRSRPRRSGSSSGPRRRHRLGEMLGGRLEVLRRDGSSIGSASDRVVARALVVRRRAGPRVRRMPPASTGPRGPSRSASTTRARRRRRASSSIGLTHAASSIGSSTLVSYQARRRPRPVGRRRRRVATVASGSSAIGDRTGFRRRGPRRAPRSGRLRGLRPASRSDPSRRPGWARRTCPGPRTGRRRPRLSSATRPP